MLYGRPGYQYDMIMFMIIKNLAIGIFLFAPDGDQMARFDNFVY